MVSALTEIELHYSTFCYQIEETNFLLFCKISTNVTVKFGDGCFFKDIIIYGHKFLRTFQNVSESYFRVIFKSDSENHKSQDNFSFIFFIFIKLSGVIMASRGSFFFNFRKITIKKQSAGVYILLPEIPRTNNQ